MPDRVVISTIGFVRIEQKIFVSAIIHKNLNGELLWKVI
jgi:hypothetical protein